MGKRQSVSDAAMTPVQRAEVDVAAMQRQLLAFEGDLADLLPELDRRNQVYQAARAEFEVAKLRARLLRERIRAIQSVLRSVSAF